MAKLNSKAPGLREVVQPKRAARVRTTMLIGELARLAGASVQAVRLYERRGLMGEPERTASGYRVYQPLDLEILKAIKRCQSLGLTLTETKRITRILEKTRQSGDLFSPGRDRECLEEIEQIGLQKLGLLDARIRELSATKGELRLTLRQIRAAIDVGVSKAS